MKKSIFLIFAAILCATSAWAAKERVYFVNTPGWTEVYVHAWGGSAAGTSWPGATATKDSWQWNGKDVYYLEAEEGAYENCIFNNGSGTQTGNLTWTENSVFVYKKSDKTSDLNKWFPVEAAKLESIGKTVYFVNKDKWSSVYVHAWSDVSGVGTSWPGVTATKVVDKQIDGCDVYSYTLDKEYDQILFHSNDGKQTSDLLVYDGIDKYYYNNVWQAETVADITIYFVNTKSWSAVNAYVWVGETSYKAWPGEAMTSTGDKAHGYDVYSYTFPETYTNCIFNNGNSQTGDLTVIAGQYYDIASAQWYASLNDIPNPAPVVKETVYFVNTGSWEKVYAYAWKSSNNGWPGAELTANGEKIGEFDIYPFEAESGQWTNIIFNNDAGTQTADLEWETGKYYVYSTQTWYDTKADAENALATPLPDETVYFVNNKSWTKVQVYGFEGSKGNADPAWPGTDITTNKTGEKVGEYDVYSFTAKQGEYAKIIFNNKEGDTGEQTNNLVWTNGKYYYMEAPTDYEGGTADEVKTAIDNLVTYDYYIADNGSLSGNADWSSKAIGLTDDNSDGVYEKTFTAQAAGTYLLKVTNGTWNDGYVWGFSAVEGAYEEVNAGESDNNIEITLTTATTFTVKFDKNAKRISFDGLTPVTTTLTYRVQVPEGTEACFIAGPCGDWSFREMTREGETDIFKIEITGAKETDEYKYACHADWAYAEVIEGGGNRTAWKELDQVEEWGKPADPAEVKYVLMGVNGDWTNGIPLTVNPGNSSEYMLLNQPIFSATDSIKIVKLENGQAKHWCGNVENNEIKIENKVNDNIVLKDGIYDFYYKVNDDKVYIALVGYARNVTNTYGTICLPYASASTSGATFYEVVGQETGKVYLASVTSLTAGVPYIFEKNQSATQIKVVYTGDKEDAASSANGLIGTFVDETAVPANNYILYDGKLCPTDGTAKVNAYRAYLDLSAVEGGAPTQKMPGRRYIGMDVQGENETTGVEDIFTTDAPVKVIENGQLIIIRDGVKYNVQGQKL